MIIAKYESFFESRRDDIIKTTILILFPATPSEFKFLILIFSIIISALRAINTKSFSPIFVCLLAKAFVAISLFTYHLPSHLPHLLKKYNPRNRPPLLHSRPRKKASLLYSLKSPV